MSDADSGEKETDYGIGRNRVGVSYADVERAAITLLKASRRPTIETLRQQIGSGAPSTLGNLLNRFWRDLGLRIEGDPVALSRLPAEIAELADGMWQRSLTLASQVATLQNNEARARLQEQELKAELRAESFYLREREWDQMARERERMLIEARGQLLSALKSLTKERTKSRRLEDRITILQRQALENRGQLAALIGSVTRCPIRKNASPRGRGTTKRLATTPMQSKTRRGR